MGVRRDLPPLERSMNTITLRLPDGTVKEMPVDDRRSAGRCCFCGESLERADSEWIRLSAQWLDGGQEVLRSWDAHRRCLVERMHDSAGA
jgi:hypothetical protein